MKTFRTGFLVMLCILFTASFIQTGYGQETATLEVMDPAVCASVENLNCVDPKEEFTVPVERLYCWTRIVGSMEDTQVTHVWYYGDVERARIPLDIRSSSYRTYSSKKIQEFETGKWHVDILDAAGNVLKSVPFSIAR